MIALSFSRWRDADCPHRFNSLHVAKTYKEPESDPMRIGGEVAEAIKNYRITCLRTGKREDPALMQAILKDRKWTDADRAAELLEVFQASNWSTVPLESPVVLVERKFAFDSKLHVIQTAPKEDDNWFSKDAAFRVIGDYVYREGDTLHIVDEKTGNEWTDPDPLQLELSAYLIYHAIKPLELGGVSFIQGHFNVLSRGARNHRIDLPVIRVEEIGAIKQKILDRLQEVNSWTEYPARVCEKCAFCSIPDCPIKEEVSTSLTRQKGAPSITIPTAIKTQEEAEKALEFAIFADGIVGKVKGLLKSYVKDNGTVYTGGMQAAINTSETWEFDDLPGLLSTLVAYGVEKDLIWKHVKLSKSELEKLAKKGGIMNRMAILSSMAKRKTTETFRIQRDTLSS